MSTNPANQTPEQPGCLPVKANAQQAVAVTPSDTVVQKYDALYIGVSGNVTVDMPGLPGVPGNTSVQFLAVPVGMLPVSCIRVRAATTATNIVGLNW